MGGGSPPPPHHARPPPAEETDLRTYIIRKLLIPNFIVTSMVFLLIRLIPGDIIDVTVTWGPRPFPDSRRLRAASAWICRAWPLDGQILQGNLGTAERS